MCTQGVSLQYLLYYDLRPWSNDRSMDKAAKDNGQTFLVDGQSYANKIVHQNIAKINGIRSKVKIKFWQKSVVKAENRS